MILKACLSWTCIAVISAAIAVIHPADSWGQTQDDFADLAAKFAPDIAAHVIAKQGTATFRVAIFPPGNSEGKVTIQMNEPQTVLQGELIVALVKKAAGKFLVLDKAGLAKEIKASGADPSGVGASNPAGTGTFLTTVGLDAAVVGSIDAKDASQVAADGLTKVNATLTVVFKDGTFKQVTGDANPDAIQPPGSTLPPGQVPRLKAEVLIKDSTGAFKPLPLFTVKDTATGLDEFRNVLFAIVPASITPGTPAAQYKIRISNSGNGTAIGPNGLMVSNPDDDKNKNRLYGVALLVDGVNSLYQDQGNGVIGPVVVHPKNARRWILSGPKKAIVKDTSSPEGFKLVDSAGLGHSVIDVPGFQKNDDFADQFRFANAKDSIAETVGITNDIGMIAAHFYAQELPGDTLAQQAFFSTGSIQLGTSAGPQVAHPTITIKPKFHKDPITVIRIFYRGEAGCPIPPADRIPVTP